jgi:hypothetical protein
MRGYARPTNARRASPPLGCKAGVVASLAAMHADIQIVIDERHVVRSFIELARDLGCERRVSCRSPDYASAAAVNRKEMAVLGMRVLRTTGAKLLRRPGLRDGSR